MFLKEYMKTEVLLFLGGRGSFRSSSPFQSSTFISQITAVRKVLSVLTPPPTWVLILQTLIGPH